MHIYTTLYIKRHRKTGMLYFGKTTRTDVHKYLGSGKYWIRHISMYGKDDVETIWISEPFTDKEELQEFALAFSELFNIVESDEWANLQEENGLDGGLPGHAISEEKKQRISQSMKGISRPPESYAKSVANRPDDMGRRISEGKLKSNYKASSETRAKLSTARTGAKASAESRSKRSDRMKSKPIKMSVCPHCGKEGNFIAMARWHFDNCKQKGS